MEKEQETAPLFTPEDIAKLLYLIDCAVRFTPRPEGGINMNEDARPVILKLSALQQGIT